MDYLRSVALVLIVLKFFTQKECANIAIWIFREAIFLMFFPWILTSLCLLCACMLVCIKTNTQYFIPWIDWCLRIVFFLGGYDKYTTFMRG